MSIVNKPFTFVAGTTKTGEAAQVNADFDAIYADYNGGITDANINALAQIQQSKILNLSADLNTIRASKVGSAGILTFTGNGIWTKPSTLLFIDVIVIGGGGGGGSPAITGIAGNTRAGGGGSGGGYSRKVIAAVTLGATEIVTVGDGGVGGSGGQVGGVGGTTSFGTHLRATGGNGGSFGTTDNTIGPAQTAGAGSDGLVNAAGSDGQHGYAALANVVYGGNGGASMLGGGGLGGVGGLVLPQPGKSYGGGGGGGLSDQTTSLPGGAGGQGVVIVTEYRSV